MGPRDVGRQVHRETVSIVELEYDIARQNIAVDALQRAFENTHTVAQGFGKPVLLGPQYLFDVIDGGGQLRVGRAHFRFERADEAIKERLGHPQLKAVPKRAADDPAQHVTPPLVARQDAIDDQERTGANMIGDNLE